MKTLLIIAYFDRPNMVRNALQSIKDQTSDNWHLAFIDDGSKVPGEPICKEYFPDEKVTYYRCDDTPEEKQANGGSRHGLFLNQAIHDHDDCDLVVIVCDDDALFPNYVEDLEKFYEENPDQYSYCHISEFDPLVEEFPPEIRPHSFNYTHDLSPFCTIDSSQASYRRSAFIDNNLQYPVGTVNLDASMYSQMFNLFGLCRFNGIMGQYKGWFSGQLSRSFDPYSPVDKK